MYGTPYIFTTTATIHSFYIYTITLHIPLLQQLIIFFCTYSFFYFFLIINSLIQMVILNFNHFFLDAVLSHSIMTKREKGEAP